jgi:predicted nucleic acid-binding Zn ribbon protein
VPIGEIIAHLRRTTGLGAQLEIARIWEWWDEAVGPHIAPHARPYSVRGGILRVHADSAVWMHKCSYKKWDIIRHINKQARKPIITDLFLTLNPDEDDPL